MAAVKLSDIEGMVDMEPLSKSERLALEFLEVFVPDRPLDQEEFEQRIEINSFSAEEVKQAAREAVRPASLYLVSREVLVAATNTGLHVHVGAAWTTDAPFS